MSVDEVLSQLSSLKDHSNGMAKTAEDNSIWHRDVEALETAIIIISALRDNKEN